MANEKMVLLTRKLLEKTREGELEWKEDPFEDAYFVTVANSPIYVKSLAGTEHIELRNKSGTVVESIVNGDSSLSYQDSDLVKQLFELARRNALGADKLIDAVIEELDNHIPF